MKKKKKTSCYSSRSGNSTISTTEMKELVEKLKMQHFRDSTHRNYYTVWKCFNNFFLRLDNKPEFWEDRLTLFIAHLVKENKQSQTIKSYISAIKAVLKEDGYKITEEEFLISSLTKACRIKNDQMRIRFPIRRSVLNMLLGRLEKKFGKQPYLSKLYEAMFTLAYYGLFRVGKLLKVSMSS